MTGAEANPGAVLKALREQRQWTLADVASRTGLTVSTLSKIENNRVSLNFDKLSRLSAGLDIDLAALLDPRSAAGVAVMAGRRSATRLGEGAVIETSNYRHVYHATDLLDKAVIPTVVEILVFSREAFGPLIRHKGEEFAYVIEGVVELHTDVYAPLTLRAGESIYFDSEMGHAYIAVAPGPCRILSISAPPGQRHNSGLAGEG